MVCFGRFILVGPNKDIDVYEKKDYVSNQSSKKVIVKMGVFTILATVWTRETASRFIFIAGR
jgi:hypothetical protein